MKFDGLEIKSIDFVWWTMRLHFDYNEWKDNMPKINEATLQHWEMEEVFNQLKAKCDE